ncbi:putative UDP-glucuronate 4-epimerase [Helianthus annuus]|nr:putative UDP-glucuronate 4-epimerase [Helianthus annuus]
MVYGPWGDMAYFFFTKDILKGKSRPVFTGHVYFIYQFFIRYCNINRYLSSYYQVNYIFLGHNVVGRLTLCGSQSS